MQFLGLTGGVICTLGPISNLIGIYPQIRGISEAQTRSLVIFKEHDHHFERNFAFGDENPIHPVALFLEHLEW